MKHLLIYVLLTISFCSTKAEKIAKGFVINLKNDTTYGTFNLQKFRTKELTYYKPFNWGMFALSVTFTNNNGAEIEYPANSITGFDFEFENVKYRFRSLKIDSDELQSFASDDAPTHVFAQLKAEGAFLSYYIFWFNPDVFHKYKGKGSYFNYYSNEYVKTPSGLRSIHRTYKNKNELVTILRNDLELEEEFIQTIPSNYSFAKLEEAVNNYNTFKGKK